MAAEENVVNVLYSVDDIDAINTVSATVIGSNLPILPTTLTATTKGGTSTTVTVTDWDLSDLSEGENTVYGTVWGSTTKAAAIVTVLPESFSLDDMTSVNGQTAADNALTKFPMALSDEFYLEMDVTYAAFGDFWITMKTSANAKYFGTEQVALGHNASGGFRPVDGNGEGGRNTNPDVTQTTLSTNTAYRIIVKADASTDKYSATITAPDGTQTTVTDFGFRKNSDVIDSIVMFTNNGVGSATATNIKVYSKSYVKAKFVNTDGEVIKTAVGDVSGGDFTVDEEEVFAIHSDGTGAFYNIPETNVTEHTTIVVDKVPNKYAVNEDAFVQAEVVYGIGTTNTDSIFVGAAVGDNRGPLSDADGVAVADGTHTPSTLGSYRVGFFEFPVIKAVDNEAVLAHFYVRTWHGNAFSNSNTSIRLAAYAVNDSSWTAEEKGSYTPSSSLLLSGASDAIFSNVSSNAAGYITFDVTEAMKMAYAAGLDKISFKLCSAWGGAYIADREAAVEGGAYEGKAAYLDVVPGYTVNVSSALKITKSGSLVSGTSFTVPEGYGANIYADTSSGVIAYIDDAQTLYEPVDGKIAITPSASMTLEAKTLGVRLVNGAQVRIGQGVVEADEGGYKIAPSAGNELTDEIASSGLRFIAIIDTAANGLASNLAAMESAGNDVEIGIEIYPEGSPEKAVQIKAVKYQDNSESVFTAALVNLNESNYNRVFTARAYVRVNDKIFYGNTVSRSIYEIAAGILADSTFIGGEEDGNLGYNTAAEIVQNVLKAYVNQVGIRLNLTNNVITERTSGNGAYAGGRTDGPTVFFEVTSEYTNEKYYVTITAKENAQIFGYWSDYIRLNNVSLSKYITESSLDADGKKLTLTIDPNADTSSN